MFQNLPVFYNPDGSTVPIEDMGYYYDKEMGDYVSYYFEDESDEFSAYENQL